MCIRDRVRAAQDHRRLVVVPGGHLLAGCDQPLDGCDRHGRCLLYTSDAADERSSVDLGGRRIIKKKNTINKRGMTSTRNRYIAQVHSNYKSH